MGKRLLAVAMALGMTTAMVGCGNDQNEAATAAKEPTVNNEPIMMMASGQLQEGKHFFQYENILAAEDGALATADVVEFFSYGCHHCQEFAPELEQWLEKNPSKTASYVPVVWNQTTGLYARVYYAIEPLANFDEIHHDLFKLFATFGHEKSLGEQMDKIYALLQEKGVNVEEVKQRLESKALEDKLRRSIELSKHYEITGTPTLIIEGAKRVNNQVLNSKDEFFTYVEKLIEM
jgi:thiol:disulfide interchange protein DsbA